MNIMSTRASCLFSILSLLVACAAIAQTPAEDPPKPAAPATSARPSLGAEGEKIRGLLDKLDLTAEQKKEVDAAVEKCCQGASADFDANKQKMEELSKQMMAAQLAKDAAKIKEICDQMVKLMPDPNKNFRGELRTILTDEQNKKLDSLLNAGKRMPFAPKVMAEMSLANAESLGLTDQQRARLTDGLKAADDELKKIEAERAKAVAAVNEKLKDGVEAALSAEQNARVYVFCNEGPYFRLLRVVKEMNLPAAQQQQVDQILKAEEVKYSDTKAVAKLVADVRAVLNDSQKLRFDQVMAGRPLPSTAGVSPAGDTTAKGANAEKGTQPKASGSEAKPPTSPTPEQPVTLPPL